MPSPIEFCRRLPLWAGLAMLAAGCALPQPEPFPLPQAMESSNAPLPPTFVIAPAPPPPPEDLAARRLLAFNERLRTLPAADQARELARLNLSTDPAETLELALLLAQGRSPGDVARALALVEPLARTDSPWAPLARLLQSRLAEQRRLEDQADRQAQQLRDQQRRLDQLAQQLDALRAIERSLGTRAAPASAPRSP